MEVQLSKIKCKRCGHEWTPRKANVRVCAKCRSSKFNEEKVVKAKPVQKATPAQKPAPAPAAKSK